MNDDRRRTPEAKLPRHARGRATSSPEVIIRRRPGAREGAIVGDALEGFGVPDFERRIRA